VLDTKLRPSLEAIDFGSNLIDLLEASELEVLFSAGNFTGEKLHDVDNTEMNATDFGGVVINQADHTLLPAAFDLYFFFKLSLHPRVVPIVTRCIFDGDVPSNPNRFFGMETFFSLPFSAGVLEELCLIRVAAFQDDVRDQLFERRVFLDDATGKKRLIASVQDRWQIAIDVVLEPRKRA
jgi:hypothetical protein